MHLLSCSRAQGGRRVSGEQKTLLHLLWASGLCLLRCRTGKSGSTASASRAAVTKASLRGWAVESPGLAGHLLCPRRSSLTSGGCSPFQDISFWDLGTKPTLPLSPPALSVRPAGISAETKCYLSPSFCLSPSWLQVYPDSSVKPHQIFIPSSAGWPDGAAVGSLSCQTIKATLGQCLS